MQGSKKKPVHCLTAYIGGKLFRGDAKSIIAELEQKGCQIIDSGDEFITYRPDSKIVCQRRGMIASAV